VKPLPRARVPVVKFRDPNSDMNCDVCLDNILACENTLLLKTYADVDPRVRQLVLIVKFWAKRRNINSAYHGTLSSYAYVILVIFYLQIVGVVPNLQKIRGPNTTQQEVDRCIDGHNVYFWKDLSALNGYGPNAIKKRNSQSVGELLRGFFHFLSEEFRYRDNVVSIREATELSKVDKDWTKDKTTRKDRYFFCIEDPFEITHNLGRVADHASLFTMRGEFKRAHKHLSKGGSLQDLCALYTEGENESNGQPGRRERGQRTNNHNNNTNNNNNNSNNNTNNTNNNNNNQVHQQRSRNGQRSSYHQSKNNGGHNNRQQRQQQPSTQQ